MRQVNIIATGNYSFFNLLTIALCLPLLDDACLPGRVAAWIIPAAASQPRHRPRVAAGVNRKEDQPPQESPAGGLHGRPEGTLYRGEALQQGSLLRRCVELLGVAAGLAPVVYASARLVRPRLHQVPNMLLILLKVTWSALVYVISHIIFAGAQLWPRVYVCMYLML